MFVIVFGTCNILLYIGKLFYRKPELDIYTDTLCCFAVRTLIRSCPWISVPTMQEAFYLPKNAIIVRFNYFYTYYAK